LIKSQYDSAELLDVGVQPVGHFGPLIVQRARAISKVPATQKKMADVPKILIAIIGGTLVVLTV
jgi:hypothetical protein